MTHEESCTYKVGKFWKRFRNKSQEKVPDIHAVLIHAQTCAFLYFGLLNKLVEKARTPN